MFIGCGGSSYGEAETKELVSVSGYVHDINGNPVSGAAVSISSDPFTFFTNAEGYFSAEVEAGTRGVTHLVVLNRNVNKKKA